MRKRASYSLGARTGLHATVNVLRTYGGLSYSYHVSVNAHENNVVAAGRGSL